MGEYINSTTPISIRHNKCGNIYKTTPTNFLSNGSRCTKCNLHGKSYSENELYNYIYSLDNSAEKNKRFYFSGKSYKEADIIIENKKIIFEYNGLYWHSEEVADTKLNLLEKTIFFNNLGYRVVHIFEDEWLEKKEIVKSKIRSILNLNKNEIKIYARNCKIKELSSNEKNLFLEKYHIQGKDISKYSIGLFFKDKLVSVMTFCKPRIALGSSKKLNNFLELSRFASIQNIPGAFSKLLKYSILKYNIENIITYADLRWSDRDKNVYLKNNFTLDHISNPTYYYLSTDKQHRFHRFNFRKQLLKKKFPDIFDKKLTEYEIMRKAGRYRIWDCGNLVFLYKKF